jgi:hypothetical protein
MATYIVGCRDGNCPDPAAVHAGEIEGLKVVWTILAIVAAVSLLVIGGIVHAKTSHDGWFRTPTNEMKSEDESPNSALRQSVYGFEIFISDENGLSHGQSFSIENEINDADFEEGLVSFRL